MIIVEEIKAQFSGLENKLKELVAKSEETAASHEAFEHIAAAKSAVLDHIKVAPPSA